MTSLDRKTRAVNAQDIASQLKMKDKESLKSLKSKNSELLAKFREKHLNEDGNQEETKSIDNKTNKELYQDSDKRLIPKIDNSFQGVVFEDKTENKDLNNSKPKKNFRKGKKYNNKGKPNKNSRFKKFKPFNRSSKTKENENKTSSSDGSN